MRTTSIPGAENIAAKLASEEVDGKRLQGLQSKREVKEALKLPFGKATKVWQAFQELTGSGNNPTPRSVAAGDVKAVLEADGQVENVAGYAQVLTPDDARGPLVDEEGATGGWIEWEIDPACGAGPYSVTIVFSSSCSSSSMLCTLNGDSLGQKLGASGSGPGQELREELTVDLFEPNCVDGANLLRLETHVDALEIPALLRVEVRPASVGGGWRTPEAVNYRCIKRAAVRNNFEQSGSERTGFVEVGDEITVVEQRLTEDGVTRLRFERGSQPAWVSCKSKKGDTLLVEVQHEPEPQPEPEPEPKAAEADCEVDSANAFAEEVFVPQIAPNSEGLIAAKEDLNGCVHDAAPASAVVTADPVFAELMQALGASLEPKELAPKPAVIQLKQGLEMPSPDSPGPPNEPVVVTDDNDDDDDDDEYEAFLAGLSAEDGENSHTFLGRLASRAGAQEAQIVSGPVGGVQERKHAEMDALPRGQAAQGQAPQASEEALLGTQKTQPTKSQPEPEPEPERGQYANSNSRVTARNASICAISIAAAPTIC